MKAQIYGKKLSIVYVNGGPILNMMSLTMLKKLGKRREELIPTNIKMTNSMGGATPTLGVLVAKITI